MKLTKKEKQFLKENFQESEIEEMKKFLTEMKKLTKDEKISLVKLLTRDININDILDDEN